MDASVPLSVSSVALPEAAASLCRRSHSEPRLTSKPREAEPTELEDLDTHDPWLQGFAVFKTKVQCQLSNICSDIEQLKNSRHQFQTELCELRQAMFDATISLKRTPKQAESTRCLTERSRPLDHFGFGPESPLLELGEDNFRDSNFTNDTGNIEHWKKRFRHVEPRSAGDVRESSFERQKTKANAVTDWHGVGGWPEPSLRKLLERHGELLERSWDQPLVESLPPRPEEVSASVMTDPESDVSQTQCLQGVGADCEASALRFTSVMRLHPETDTLEVSAISSEKVALGQEDEMDTDSITDDVDVWLSRRSPDDDDCALPRECPIGMPLSVRLPGKHLSGFFSDAEELFETSSSEVPLAQCGSLGHLDSLRISDLEFAHRGSDIGLQEDEGSELFDAVSVSELEVTDLTWMSL